MGYAYGRISGLLLGALAALWATTSPLVTLGALSFMAAALVLTPWLSLGLPTQFCLPILAGALLGQIFGVGSRFPLETVVAAAAIGVALLIFIEIRHVTIRRRRRVHPLTAAADWRRRRGEKGGERPLYILAVLGSGGHTKEMLLMMGSDFRAPEESHRRYVVTKGDDMSAKQAKTFEGTLKGVWEHTGTYDICMATRARHVHQSLLTTPLSALRSILDIFPILLSRPGQVSPGSPIDVPDVIFTNGPATGFFVAVVAHMLRIFYIVPEHKMRVLFIESWARVSSLSLTGKLFYYTGIADMFLVQHEAVANTYGVLNAGWLVLDPSQRHRDVS